MAGLKRPINAGWTFCGAQHLFDPSSVGQLDLRLPQLAHDLLHAVSLLRHFDLPSTTQIMRLHLDPF